MPRLSTAGGLSASDWDNDGFEPDLLELQRVFIEDFLPMAKQHSEQGSYWNTAGARHEFNVLSRVFIQTCD